MKRQITLTRGLYIIIGMVSLLILSVIVYIVTMNLVATLIVGGLYYVFFIVMGLVLINNG